VTRTYQERIERAATRILAAQLANPEIQRRRLQPEHGSGRARLIDSCVRLAAELLEAVDELCQPPLPPPRCRSQVLSHRRGRQDGPAG